MYTTRNKVTIIPGGKPWFERLHRLIETATQTLYLQFYIIEADETGLSVLNSLKTAARRGVAVYLMADGYASQGIPSGIIHDLREAGVLFKWFEPLFRSRHFYFGRRLHHKVVVADAYFALVGGVNISDRYNDLPDQEAWLDRAVFCEGEAAGLMHQQCRELFDKKNTDSIDQKALALRCGLIPETEQVMVRVRRNDWVKRRTEIWNTYLEVFNTAEKEIIIMCSYFLPGRYFRKRMALAAKRGVQLRVILAGRSDVMVAKQAERFLYTWLLKNKIRIFEYQRTILHAKMAVCDDAFVTVGSYNVNNISAYASLELNIDIKHKTTAALCHTDLERIMTEDCREITYENFEPHTHFFPRLWQRLCYGFINNVLNLFTFYFRQEE